MTDQSKQTPIGRVVVEVPQNIFDEVIAGLKKIDRMERVLETMKVLPSTDWLIVDEFLAKTKVSRWKFYLLRDSGKLNMKKIGRKWYIHPGDVQRFFDGELTLDA